MATQKCIEYKIKGSTYRTEYLYSPLDIEIRLQSLFNSYGLNLFKSDVKIKCRIM